MKRVTCTMQEWKHFYYYYYVFFVMSSVIVCLVSLFLASYCEPTSSSDLPFLIVQVVISSANVR